MVQVMKSVTINKPRNEVYRFWRDFANLPRFMRHLESVTAGPGTQSHWVAKGPGGTRVEWDAELVEDQPGEMLAWRSVGGTRVPNAGTVIFADAPAGRGTELQVEIRYDPPAGSVGAALAKLLGEEPGLQLRDDLRRFKQVMETGEVVRSDGSPEGAGQGYMKQHAAQPADMQQEAS
jgi:uncharacterized membrane protein